MQKKDKNQLEAMRHSAEHVLTQAMLKLYPSLLMAMGPATEDGFYFDFETEAKISEEDFPKIEAEIEKIIKKDLPIKREEISITEARKLFANNPYKQEWLDEIEEKGEKATIYWTGEEFVDLCAGPHVASTKEIGFVKLLSVAGAYWRGSEKNKMLTRIYGTAFPTQKELEDYLSLQEMARERDHRKLGKKLDLFTFSGLVGSGLPLYTTKGAVLRRLVNEYVEELQRQEDYFQVWTPQIAKADLFKTSGHYDKYKDSMFRVSSNYSEEDFFLKPMNCPQHTQIYASQMRSYRDLPIRMTDFAMLYRDEKPGELSGLARVRSFSQDDCHIFCREDQVDEEVDKALAMTKQIMATYGFKYRYRLSTRDLEHPEKYLGDPETWEKVEKWAETIMKRNKIDYFEGPGEAAFYAPKMDLMATDTLGREWQLSTIQIDYFMPQRFNLEYIDKDGSKKHPIMLHRAIIGSPERFLMVLIEHYAGAFPTWLAPIQVKVIPVSQKSQGYAQKVTQKVKEKGIRVELDERDEPLGGKIRNAQEEKIPYMLILGEKEAESGKVSLRKRSGEDLGQVELEDFLTEIKEEIEKRT